MFMNLITREFGPVAVATITESSLDSADPSGERSGARRAHRLPRWAAVRRLCRENICPGADSSSDRTSDCLGPDFSQRWGQAPAEHHREVMRVRPPERWQRLRLSRLWSRSDIPPRTTRPQRALPRAPTAGERRSSESHPRATVCSIDRSSGRRVRRRDGVRYFACCGDLQVPESTPRDAAEYGLSLS